MYRLNWAAHGINERKSEIFTEYSVFVGDLSPEVTDYLLLQTFAEKYVSVRSAKVVIDVNTGLSKRYGFVRFGNEEEMNRALSEMQGQYCGSRFVFFLLSFSSFNYPIFQTHPTPTSL